MNKYLSKIVGAVASLALVIGAGVGIANDKKASPVYADDQTATWTAASGGLGSGVGSGTITDNKSFSWSYTRTLVSGSSYTGWTSNCIQLGKNGGIENLTLSTSSIPGTIKTVSVDCASYSGAHNVSITVGSSTYLSSTATSSWTTVETKSGTGTSEGTITISFTGGSRAMYIKSVSVVYDNGEVAPEPTGYTVSFNANGGTGSMSSISDVEGQYTLPSNGFTAPSGKTFMGWKANNAGDLIKSGAKYTVSANMTFYAQWGYTVRYNNNGGSGTITDSSSPYAPSSTVTVKSNTFTAPFADMVFDKWNTAADGSGQDFAPGATFSISAATTLYAQWKDNPSIPYSTVYSTGFEDGEGFDAGSVYNSEKDDGPDGRQWHIYYGTASTDVKIKDDQALQMRWYSSAKERYPYIKTNFSIPEVKRINFKYRVSNENLDFEVQYNADGGDEWTTIETINTEGTSINSYRKIFDTPISSMYFRIIVCPGTAPSSGSYKLTIDDVSFSTIATLASINGSDTASVGSQWSPTNITENVGGAVVTGATYSFAPAGIIASSNASTGAFTANAEGTVIVSAVKSGYIISSKNVTVEPVDPFVNKLSKTSTSGFTGQNETISFKYGNLTNPLNVESSDTDVVTIGTLSYSDGSGTVQLNFVGAGSTTVAFKHGSTPLGVSITVSVAASEVEITGMPSTRRMGNGTSLNLSSFITVTATGACSDDVTWSSSVPAVATVNSSGVVSAVSIGSTVITATPNDYPAGAVSCTITVANEKALLAKTLVAGDTVFLGSSAVSMQYNGPSSTSTVFGFGASFVGSPSICDFALLVEEGSEEDTFALKIKEGTYANKYLSWSADNSLAVSESKNANSSWDISIDEDGNATIKSAADATRIIWWNVSNPRFACYTGKSDGASYKYVQLWKLITPNTYLNSATTTKTIHGHENYTDEVVTSVDSVYIKFGATIAKEKWDAIKANWTISDYGVMLMKSADLTAGGYTSIEDAFNKGASSSVLKNINQRAGGAAYEDPYEGDNCIFTIRVNFPDNNTYYNDVIYAVPYVVVSGQYYFLDEVHTSIHELATNYYNTGYEYLSDAALGILKA